MASVPKGGSFDFSKILPKLFSQMQPYFPQVGDMIAVKRLGYIHVGNYVGSRTPDGRDVVHNDKSKGVVLTTLAEFSGGAPVFLHKQATGNYFQREATANRAFSLIGRKFDLLTFNCEHAANLIQSGYQESPQLQAYAFAALICLGLFAFAKQA